MSQPLVRWAAALALLCLGGRGAAAQPAAGPAADVVPPPVQLSFQDAVARALQRNPTLLVAQTEVRRAQALVEQVRAPALPSLVANATYTRLDADRVLGDRVLAGVNQFNATGTLTVPVLLPSRWQLWTQARLARDLAALTAVDVRRQMALTTARTYLALVAQHRTLDVLVRARDTARAHRDFAHARTVGGVGPRLDETRAEQELATDESQLETAQGDLVRAQEALGVLLGSEVPVDSADPPRFDELPDADEALRESESGRSDVRLARQRLYTAEQYVRRSFVEFLPSLVASLQGFYQSPPTPTLPETGWQATFVLTLPLYDGGLRYGQIHERRALADEARIGLEGISRQARADVRAAQAALGRSRQALLAAQRASQAAAEALRLSTLAYKSGAATNLEVIDAERRARDSDTTAIIAEDRVRQDALDLLSAAGRFPAPR